MRLDNVLVRIRDTRVFIEFETGEVIREYVAKEEKYEVVRQASDHRTSSRIPTNEEIETRIERSRCASPITRSQQPQRPTASRGKVSRAIGNSYLAIT